ncbi:MAG: histidine phosphatase family protein [Thermoplasmata archaeon]
MMDLAILVRHGESYTNKINIVSEDVEKYSLTELGIKQANNVAKELKKIGIEHIYSSPIRRARETAGIISNELKMDVELDYRLKEIGFGKFNGKKLEDVPDFTYQSNEIEPWENIEKRMLSIIEEKEGKCLLVSHAFPIRVIIAHYLSLGEDESFGIFINYATISMIDVKKGKVIAIGSPKVTKYMENGAKL